MLDLTSRLVIVRMEGSPSLKGCFGCVTSAGLRRASSRRRGTAEQIGRLHAVALFVKALAGSVPANLVDVVEDRHVQSQGRQRAKQKSVGPRTEQRPRQPLSATD